MRKAIAAAAALGGLMSLGFGVAHADTVQVDGAYSTMEACQVDGPNVQITENDGAYGHWYCEQGADGLYHLMLSS
jgi:hypothetical protein